VAIVIKPFNIDELLARVQEYSAVTYMTGR